MQQQHGHALNQSEHEQDINWLEYWPESEFRLEQAPAAAAAGGADHHIGGPPHLLASVDNMLPHAHNSEGGQQGHPGTLQDGLPYGNATGDRVFQVRLMFHKSPLFTARLGLL